MTLQARDISKSFRNGTSAAIVPVLDQVSIDASEGEFVSIVGPSGSGKSTLLYCLSGLEKLDGGTVSVLGTRIDTASAAEAARLRRDTVGFVFQSYNLVPSITVRENVELPGRLAGKRRTIAAAAAIALDAVGLSKASRKYPGHLSGGEQQRVAIARVLANNPRIIFADEPTGALDSHTGALILDLLVDRARQGSTVVLVTHDLAAAARADRVFVMRDGRVGQVLERSTPTQILDAMSLPSSSGVS